MSDRRVTIAWLVVTLMAVGIAARAGVQIVQSESLMTDRDAYLALARTFQAKGVYARPDSDIPTAYRPPLYPVLLAATTTLLPAGMAVALLNLLASAAIIAGTYLLARALSLDELPALLAAAIVTFDPLLVWSSKDAMTEIVFTAIMTGTLWMTVRGNHSGKRPGRWGMLAGGLFGLAGLCRPTALPWMICWLVMIIVPSDRAGGTGSTQRRFALAAVAVSGAILALWGLRNLWQMDRFLVTTTHGGYTLLLGNNPTFDRDVLQAPPHVWPGESLVAWQAELEQRQRHDLGGDFHREVAVDRWCRDEAVRWITSHPSRFVAAAVYRMQSLWSPGPRGPEATGLPIIVRVPVVAWSLTLFALAAIGAATLMRDPQRSRWWPILVWVAVVVGIHLFYWADARMRAPIAPVLAVLAARALALHWLAGGSHIQASMGTDGIEA
ncbi:MAG: glycosyltransferase family 39 protein [Planctomycetaceae bacterium]|nr:glycosyltransferase family 39 protein [Planctomycetaceae bacterium]